MLVSPSARALCATGELVRTLEGHTDTVWAVAWSSDGRRVVSGSADKTIKIWSAETGASAAWKSVVCFAERARCATGEVVRTLEGHTSIVYAVAWSSDGQRVVSGSEDKTIKIWSAETGASAAWESVVCFAERARAVCHS